MPSVNVSINGQQYPIACDDGQEAHVARLADYVDKRVKELIAAVGHVGDNRLLVMTGIILADEMSDAYAEMESLKGTKQPGSSGSSADDAVADSLNAIAARIESIADGLEQA